MAPAPRTTHQRDRRFARVRALTRTIFVGSGVLSLGMVGYLSSITKLHTVAHPTTRTTATTSTTTTAGATGVTGIPTTTVAPVTTTTTCYTTPSGTVTCN